MKMLINKIIIPNNCISSPLNGNIAKLKVIPTLGINRVKIENEQTGQPAENKLITPVKIPTPDSFE